MQVFIDESGNLGTLGRYFVIAALVPTNPQRIKNLIKHSCVKYGKGGGVLDEIKGFRLDFTERQDFINFLIKKDDFTISYIVADKKHLVPRILSDKNICYNYLAGHLLKPILRGASQDLQITFDNHTTKVASVNSLKDYVKIKAYAEWGIKHNFTIQYEDSRVCKNLQAIDVIANTILGNYQLLKPHAYSMLETKFQHRVRFPQGKFGA